MKVTDYKIIEALTPWSLQKEVLLWIEKGWEPLGNPVVNLGSGMTYSSGFLQAMIKEEK